MQAREQLRIGPTAAVRPALRPQGPGGRGARARARAASGRDPDRQSARHHAAGAGGAGRRRPDRLRGHPRHPQAPRSLRHRDPADPLSRPQRRGGAAEADRAAGRRRRHRAGLRCRHAAHFRPRLQAGARRPGRRPCGDPVPGASAALAALSVAGLPTDRFFFEGFLPAKAGQRQARIAELARIPATLVLFETGPRLAASLADLAAGLARARPRSAAS